MFVLGCIVGALSVMGFNWILDRLEKRRAVYVPTEKIPAVREMLARP
jgi:hypothetical protein